jgi:arylsulfatase A-like enzyme
MKKQPNILIINTDQHRYDCTGKSGLYPVKTPNIDRIAGEGAWFTHAYTPIPLCCPARQAFLAGKRPEAFGALWNYDLTLKVQSLTPEQFHWTGVLKQQGYQLGYIGKWHVSDCCGPKDFGFDDYIPVEAYARFRAERYGGSRGGPAWFGAIDETPLEDSRTHWLARKAAALMREYRKRGQPWHIRLDLPEPHLPCTPVKEFAELYEAEKIPKWAGFDEGFENKPYIQRQQLKNWNIEKYTWKDWSNTVAKYYAVISQVDDAIGRVLDVLSEAGESENTLVIYTTDHGDMCGSHRMMDKHYIMYDDVVRVPLAMRFPALFNGGRICNNFVCHYLDLVPTIMDIIGSDPPADLHGRSLLPLLQGRVPDDWPQEVVSTYNGNQFGLFTQRMLRTKHWKYVWNTTDVDELYNLEHDPGELNNLIHDPSLTIIIRDLRARLFERLRYEEDGLVGNKWIENQLLQNRKM